MKFSQIYEGFRNHLIPPKELKGYIQKASDERLVECLDCPFNSTSGIIESTSRCVACGCYLIPKSKCLSCNCGLEVHNKKNPKDNYPLKWFAVLNAAQEERIETAIKKEDENST